jgi:uncharacterized membrane protein YtjA (UPF0391 family)
VDASTLPFNRCGVRAALDMRFGANLGGHIMLRWALIFFIVAIVAALFGFGGIAAGAASIAKILFFGFLVVAAIMLLMGLSGRRGVV